MSEKDANNIDMKGVKDLQPCEMVDRFNLTWVQARVVAFDIENPLSTHVEAAKHIGCSVKQIVGARKNKNVHAAMETILGTLGQRMPRLRRLSFQALEDTLTEGTLGEKVKVAAMVLSIPEQPDEAEMHEVEAVDPLTIGDGDE